MKKKKREREKKKKKGDGKKQAREETFLRNVGSTVIQPRVITPANGDYGRSWRNRRVAVDDDRYHWYHRRESNYGRGLNSSSEREAIRKGRGERREGQKE